LPQYALRMRDCSRYLSFRLKVGEDGEKNFKLDGAKFCRCRFCPTCQSRRSSKWVARSKKAFPLILQDYPNYKFAFLTLTTKNCPLDELRQTIKHMNESWSRLTKLKQWPVVGFMKSIEVTRSKDGLAHPHIHVILMFKPSYFSGKTYLSQAKWTDLWQKCLRVDYTPIVNIKVIKPAKGENPSSYIELIESAIVECVKYSVKPDDFQGVRPENQLTNSQWLEGITEQLLKTRAISLGGIIKDYMSEEEPEDLINIEEDEPEQQDYVLDQYIFAWHYALRRYVLFARKASLITVQLSDSPDPHTE